jgi:hypothetical protein
MQFLSMRQSGEWTSLKRDYEEALANLRSFRERTSVLVAAERDHRLARQSLTAQRLELEKSMGDHWRNTVQPLLKAVDTADGQDKRTIEQQYLEALEVRNQLYAEPLKQIQYEAAAARIEARRLRTERRAQERSQQILDTRAKLQSIVEQAERARLETVKTAFLTVDSLTHTDYRPTAWWFPLVDPEGAWINSVRETAVARWEELVTPLT